MASKRKAKQSHPSRAAAVKMLQRGEATPNDIALALMVSRQLVRYWCIAAGIAGKTKEARKNYLAWRLLRDMPEPTDGKPEHPAIAALRARLKRPRPDRAQIQAAKDRTASDVD